MKYDLVREENESFEAYQTRCLAFLAQVPTLSDEALLSLPCKELIHLHSKNYARFLKLMNPTFPQMYSNVTVEDVIAVPFFQIFPRSMCDENWPPSEWDYAEVGATRTKGPIEVKVIDKRKLIVLNGHNRLKDEVANGNDKVLVKIKQLVERDCMISQQKAITIMMDLDIPEEARRYAAEIVAIWDTPVQ